MATLQFPKKKFDGQCAGQKRCYSYENTYIKELKSHI
jgi:hypothetical protein